MAEQNPLEEKIKEFEDRAKQLHEEGAKKERTEKIEKEPIRPFSDKPTAPLTAKGESQKLPRSSLDSMPSILTTAPSFASSEKKPHYDVPWIYKCIRRKAALSMLIVGLLGFLFVANTPYFNKWYHEKKRISSYNSRLYDIQNDIAKKRYDGIEAKVRTLANDLENEKKQQSRFAYKIADKNLKKLESLSYIKQVKVEAKTEKKLVKEGHYEKVWVEPQYETRWKTNWLNVALKPLYTVLTPILSLGGQGPITEPQTKSEEKVKVKEGHYKNGEWHDPVYETIIISPAHYKKLEINPLSGKEKIVEDNIPIK